MQKVSNIYVTITNNVANFKVRLPWDWCKNIGLTEKNKGISVKYENNCLVIEKQKERLFSDLSTEEKILQINKYNYLYGNKFDKKKDFLEEVEKYFKITYRTAYRYLREEISFKELENVSLISEQSDYIRHTHLMLRNGIESITATLTIPSALAILFLQGKTPEELGIKNIIEVYNENVTLPILLECSGEKIIIKSKGINEEDIKEVDEINTIEKNENSGVFEEVFVNWK